jgi:hypothetical protein
MSGYDPLRDYFRLWLTIGLPLGAFFLGGLWLAQLIGGDTLALAFALADIAVMFALLLRGLAR